jgi:hypothetical protein
MRKHVITGLIALMRLRRRHKRHHR